jgi:hypothetical protein
MNEVNAKNGIKTTIIFLNSVFSLLMNFLIILQN